MTCDVSASPPTHFHVKVGLMGDLMPTSSRWNVLVVVTSSSASCVACHLSNFLLLVIICARYFVFEQFCTSL